MSKTITVQDGDLVLTAVAGNIVLVSSADLTLDAPIFILEQAAANADVATYGQFWVRNDTPNVPMFTDDAGEDFALNFSSPQTRMAKYTFDTNTSPTAPSAAGEFKGSTANPSSWIRIHVSNTDAAGNDVSDMLQTIIAGSYLTIRSMVAGLEQFRVYNISSVSRTGSLTPGGWTALNGTHITGSGPVTAIASGEEFQFEFSNSGYVGGMQTDSMMISTDGLSVSGTNPAQGAVDVNHNAPGKIFMSNSATTLRTKSNLYHSYGASGQGASEYWDGVTAGENFSIYGNFSVTPATLSYEVASRAWLRIDTGGDVRFEDWQAQGGSRASGFYWAEKANAAADIAGYGQIWINSTGNILTYTDENGTDFPVAGGTVASVLASGTPADNQVAVWTSTTNTLEGDANFTWTGTTLAIAGAGSQLLLPLENDAATPTLAFGDGDTGLYEAADDDLYVTLAGTQRWVFDVNFFGTFNTARPALRNVTPSATSPDIVPVQTDFDTGIGWAAAD